MRENWRGFGNIDSQVAMRRRTLAAGVPDNLGVW